MRRLRRQMLPMRRPPPGGCPEALEGMDGHNVVVAISPHGDVRIRRGRRQNRQVGCAMSRDDFRPPPAKVRSFRAPYAPPDEEIAAAFLQTAPFPSDAEARIDARAGGLVRAIRAHAGGVG